MTKEELKKYTVDFMNNETCSKGSKLNSVLGKMLIKYAEIFQKQIAELEAQIEKMKRCEICKHYRWNHCSYETNISADCIQNKLKHFELREIKEK